MPPNVRFLHDLYYLAGVWHCRGSQGPFYRHTSFVYFDEQDRAYFGKIVKPSPELTLQEISSALRQIPDEVVFPPLPGAGAGPPWPVVPSALNLAPVANLWGIFVKRPLLKDFDFLTDTNSVHMIPRMFFEEARVLQHISRRGPHPNIVRFHGCRVRAGRITGLVFDRYRSNLKQFIRERRPIDKERVLGRVRSANQFLRSLGLALPEVKLEDIMIDERNGEPVLGEPGLCSWIEPEMPANNGTPGWTGGDDDMIAMYTLIEPLRLLIDREISSLTHG